MSNPIRFRRGLRAAQRTYVLAEGEPGYCTDTKTAYIGDGQTPGGIPIGGGGVNLEGYSETVKVLGNVTGAVTVDLSLGNIFVATVTGAVIWSVLNVPGDGRAASFTLELTNGGSSAQTWMPGATWPGGAPPTLTAAGVDILTFITRDGGATWRGALAQKDSK